MSDSASNQTDIDGGAAAPVLSGTFSAGVEVHIATGPDADALAQQLLRDYGPPMANLKATMGTQQRLVELETWVKDRAKAEDEERRLRIAETDHYRQALERRITHIEASVNRSLWTSAAAFLAAGAAWIRGETRT